MSETHGGIGDRGRTLLGRLRPGFGKSATPAASSPAPATVVVDAATAKAVSRLQEVLGPDDTTAGDAMVDVAAFVVGARRDSAGGAVQYEVQVCVLRHDGTLELRAVRHRFRSFYELYRRVRTSADVDLTKDTGGSAGTGEGDAESGATGAAGGTRRRRELQRFLDEVLGDAAARRRPEVAAFLALDAAADWTVPRYAQDALRNRTCCCAHAAAVEAAAERAQALEAALAACAAERDEARAETEQLRARLVHQDARARQVASEHAAELEAVRAQRAMAEERVAAQEQQLAVLVARVGAVDRENAALHEARALEVRRTAWARGTARAAAAECAALRARTAALETRAATLAGQLRRAVEDANMLRALLRASGGGDGSALPPLPPLTTADVLEYGDSLDEFPLELDGQEQEQGQEEPVLGTTKEEQKVAARVWKETLGRTQALGRAVELLAQRAEGAADAERDAARLRAAVAARERECATVGARAEALASALCAAERAEAAAREECAHTVAEAQRSQTAANTERDAAHARLAQAQAATKAAEERCAALERAQEAAVATQRDTLLPTLGVLRGALCDAAEALHTRAARAVLQRYLARQLVVELALLRRELESCPGTSSTSSHEQQQQKQLVYTRALAEGLEDWDRVEAQNAALQARADADTREAEALHARCEALEGALAAEQAQRARLAIALQTHGLDANGADVSADAVAERLALEKRTRTLEEQLADMRQRYFYSLAMDIKLQTQSTCDLASLYVDELPRANITVAEWPRWLTQRMRESSSPLQKSSP